MSNVFLTIEYVKFLASLLHQPIVVFQIFGPVLEQFNSIRVRLLCDIRYIAHFLVREIALAGLILFIFLHVDLIGVSEVLLLLVLVKVFFSFHFNYFE